jgi:hypothetical protein
MIAKYPIIAQRVRTVPKQFSWIDHRLVREHYIERCTLPAAALYLFLVTVTDAKGLSYYADASIMQRLGMDQATLDRARLGLIRAELIAWKKPLYQVLSLDGVGWSRQAQNPMSLAEILQTAKRTSHDRL